MATPENKDPESLFKLANAVDQQLLEESVPKVDSGYQAMDHVETFAMAMQVCEMALLEPGLHKLCAPVNTCRREFCRCVAAALKALQVHVERFESTDNDEYAWLLPNLSLVLIVEKDDESN